MAGAEMEWRRVRASLTQSWVFMESHSEAFVGSCSHRGWSCDSQEVSEELGRGKVQRPWDSGALRLVTWLKTPPFLVPLRTAGGCWGPDQGSGEAGGCCLPVDLRLQEGSPGVMQHWTWMNCCWRLVCLGYLSIWIFINTSHTSSLKASGPATWGFQPQVLHGGDLRQVADWLWVHLTWL